MKEEQLTHLVPRSHKFQAHFSLSHITATKIMTFIGNYLQLGQQTLSTAVIVDSQVVNCNRFSHQQAIHILHSLQASKRYSTCKGHQGSEELTPQPNCLAKLSQVSTVCQDRYINDSDQEKPVIPILKAYWTRTMPRGQPSKATKKVLNLQANHYDCPFRLFPSLVVGKRVCLVVLWKNPARRDKQWNYIALQFQRYTKHVQPTRYIYQHVANVWGIPIPKRIVPKYYFLSELLKEYYKVDDFIIQQNHKTFTNSSGCLLQLRNHCYQFIVTILQIE